MDSKGYDWNVLQGRVMIGYWFQINFAGTGSGSGLGFGFRLGLGVLHITVRIRVRVVELGGRVCNIELVGSAVGGYRVQGAALGLGFGLRSTMASYSEDDNGQALDAPQARHGRTTTSPANVHSQRQPWTAFSFRVETHQLV